METCAACIEALDEYGAFERYDADGDDAGLYDERGGFPSDDKALNAMARDFGVDLPDHECYAPTRCACTGHA